MATLSEEREYWRLRKHAIQNMLHTIEHSPDVLNPEYRHDWGYAKGELAVVEELERRLMDLRP